MDDVSTGARGWREWFELGASLPVAEGVHAPSRFSALLACTMGDCRDRTVIDAGSGAGLIAIAALTSGAEHVHAIDMDPSAVRATSDHVRQTLGRGGTDRLSTHVLDFASLAEVEADLLAVNPPQRPTGILDAVEADERHLHVGGGVDGLDTVRLVLRHAAASVVRTTAADVLQLGTALRDVDGWRAPVLVTRATLPMHHSWARVTSSYAAVGVWDFVRR